jgi:dehydrogenase/reductase SDR family member 7B
MNFSGKTAWVIGASSGIGAELCRQLAEKGAQVILSARNIEALERVKSTLHDSEKHVVFPFDLEKTENCPKQVATLLEKVDGIQFLFNNGGLSQRATAFDTEMQVDRRIMEINFFGNVALTKAILPHFRTQESTQIVVISSIAGKFGFFLRSAYSASKHALHGFYESLRLEEEKQGISVNIICPGKINTPISTNALSEKGEKHGVMDHNQETGMPVDICVSKILKAVQKNKQETLIGGKELLAVSIKRWFPRLFYKIIKKQSPV